MKTKNYQFDLMHQGQEHKDVVYNESILKLDANLNLSVVNFVEKPPESVSYGDRFIITSGENKNKIGYFAHSEKGIQYISPYNNMLVYMVKDDCFARFSDDSWQKAAASVLGVQSASAELKFIGIKDDFNVPKQDNCHYLYLNGKCVINFDQVETNSLTIIIKQNYQEIFEIKWPENILWPEKKLVQVTSIINSIDLFRFYKLPESKHFIAESIKQNYQY